jgi:putative transposase
VISPVWRDHHGRDLPGDFRTTGSLREWRPPGRGGSHAQGRFTEEQMVTILREADQRSVPEVAKKHSVSEQTIYAWRKRFGTLEPLDVRRLRHLEHENSRLKKLVAERDLEIEILKEITRKKW